MSSYPNLERRTYRERFSSGLLEVFIGVAIAAVGAMWLTDLAGVAGVFPVVLVPLYAPAHERLVEPHLGYAKATPAREQRERTSMLRLTLLGTVFFVAGVGTFLLANSGDLDIGSTFIAGVPAFLLAIGAAASAAWFQLPRLYVTSALLVAGGLVVVLADLHPGVAMLAPGVAILAWGLVDLVRFTRASRAL